MFTGRVLFNDFIFATLLFGLTLWISIALPVNIALGLTWPSLLVLLPVVIVFSFLWNYLFYFKSNLSPGVFIWQAIFGVTALLIFTVHLDFMLTNFGENPIKSDSFEAVLNTSYSAIILFVGGILGYANAFLKSPTLNNPEQRVSSWWTADLDLDEHAYLSPPGVSRLNRVFLGFGVFAIILIFPLFLEAITTLDPESIKLLIMRLGTMGITLIVYTTLGVSTGEAIRLIQLQRQIDKGPLKIFDFDERLKWRHDYVKYHLPAPIRKLNLRLFNQHVEAYERLQNKVKAPRT